MLPLYLPSDVQAMDQRAFARGVDPAALMDAAAAHLARGVLSVASHRYGLRVVLLCGKGNNGADGIAAARHLRRRGVAATVVLVVGEDDLGEDGVRELASWRAMSGPVRRATTAEALEEVLADTDVAVDCLLGTGATGEPRGVYAAAVAALLTFDGLVVACDLPTGVDGSTGRIPGDAVIADLTVTLGAHKRGLALPPGRDAAGEVVLGELDVDDGAADAVAWVLEAADLPSLVPPAGPRSHKRSMGVVTIYAGAVGTSGAAILCALAALRAGAGLVTLCAPSAVAHRIAGAVPEIMTVPLPDDTGGIIEAVSGQMARSDVLAIGPGLGLAADTQAAVRALVREVEVPVVLDADGLNAFRDHAEHLSDHATPLLAMTPHAQEFGRLIGSSGHGVHARRADLAAEWSSTWDATVVAKGPGSVIAAPDGDVWVNPTGGPALATGGTGDVLTGLTATFLAQRAQPSSVAAAVYVHGLAGDLATSAHGVRATSASRVAEAIGPACAELGL